MELTAGQLRQRLDLFIAKFGEDQKVYFKDNQERLKPITDVGFESEIKEELQITVDLILQSL